MKIEGENYQVFYNLANQTVSFQGTLRLNGLPEYVPINNLLHQIIEQKPENLTLDFKNLYFINSSGITMLSKFMIHVRSQKNISLIIIGNDTIPWQNKSLKNLQRLMPSLQLIL